MCAVLVFATVGVALTRQTAKPVLVVAPVCPLRQVHAEVVVVTAVAAAMIRAVGPADGDRKRSAEMGI